MISCVPGSGLSSAILDVYADYDGLTSKDIDELRERFDLTEEQGRTLKQCLGHGMDGEITARERLELIQAGFGRDVVHALAGSDGRAALRERAEDLVGSLDRSPFRSIWLTPAQLRKRIKTLGTLQPVVAECPSLREEAIEKLTIVMSKTLYEGCEYVGSGVKGAAAELLGSFGAEAEGALPFIAEKMKTSTKPKLFADAMVKIGAASLPYLMQLRQHYGGFIDVRGDMGFKGSVEYAISTILQNQDR